MDTSNSDGYVKKLKSKISKTWHRFNPFGVSELIQSIISGFDDVDSRLRKVQYGIEEELYRVKKDLEFVEVLLQTITETTPDMVWVTDTEGRYIFANANARQKLFFCEDPIGKKDSDIDHKSIGIKRKRTKLVHTFTPRFEAIDEIVSNELKKEKFIESGKINNKEVCIELYKSPVFLDDKFIGICTTGRFIKN